MSRRLSQVSSKWANVRLGESNLTVAGHGCTTAAISMGLSKLFPREWPKRKWNPGDLARYLVYTNYHHPLGEGLLIWGANKTQWKQLGIEFIGRYHGYTEKDRAMINTLSKSPEYFVIIEVARRDGGRHWLHARGNAWTWRGYGMAADDPINAKRLWKTTGLFAPYSRILGSAVFKRI